ncbi:protein hydE [uncultured Helicobacter sp.]|uniref:protein hydE n=1 Tax=uncultured Helicobacter sp. TaxID=175537 RepID=UPI002606002A|nr:protein hydE [uncultured Helicobacter sp.]
MKPVELESPLIVAFTFEQITKLQMPQNIQNFLLKALDCALRKSNLQGQFVEDSKESFSLEIQGTQQEILKFSDSLQNFIPLSLQWAFKELVILESFSQNNLIDFKKLLTNSFLTTNFLSPLELKSLCTKESPNFCNLWNEFIDFKPTKIALLEQGKRKEIKNSQDLIESLETIAKLLKQKERVFVKTIFGKRELALFDESNPLTDITENFCFMPHSLADVKLLFKAENEELQALATLEKPILKLAPKGIFNNFFPTSFVNVLLPFEPYLVLLSKFLDSFAGLYLLPLNQKRENGICEFTAYDSKPLTLSVAQNSLILPHHFKPYKSNSIANAFKQTIIEESLNRVNILYLGKHQTLFWVYFNESFKETLKFIFESNLAIIIETLKTLNLTTQSLLKNFSSHSPRLIQTLESLPKDSILSHNLLDLLGMCGVLLHLGKVQNLQDSAYAVIECARKFLGKKGPRIDFRLERNQEGEVFLNTLQTLRSVMSFKLAGVENELLCYGILDSLAEFFANFSRDMEENYQTKGIILCGELFLNTQFVNQFLHYLPKTSEVYACETMEFE